MFFVVVLPGIHQDLTNPKEFAELVQTRNALRTLCHRKLMRHLETSSVALAICSLRLANEAD